MQHGQGVGIIAVYIYTYLRTRCKMVKKLRLRHTDPEDNAFRCRNHAIDISLSHQNPPRPFVAS